MVVIVAQHPIIMEKMTALRNTGTMPSEFRRLLKEITFYLGEGTIEMLVQ